MSVRNTPIFNITSSCGLCCPLIAIRSYSIYFLPYRPVLLIYKPWRGLVQDLICCSLFLAAVFDIFSLIFTDKRETLNDHSDLYIIKSEKKTF